MLALYGIATIICFGRRNQEDGGQRSHVLDKVVPLIPSVVVDIHSHLSCLTHTILIAVLMDPLSKLEAVRVSMKKWETVVWVHFLSEIEEHNLKLHLKYLVNAPLVDRKPSMPIF